MVQHGLKGGGARHNPKATGGGVGGGPNKTLIVTPRWPGGGELHVWQWGDYVEYPLMATLIVTVSLLVLQ